MQIARKILPHLPAHLSPFRSRVRASMQNARVSPAVYQLTGWKYYLGSIPRRTRGPFFIASSFIVDARAREYRAPLVKRNTARKKNGDERNVIMGDSFIRSTNVVSRESDTENNNQVSVMTENIVR